MSIQYAQDLIKRLGPGRITLDRTLYDDLAIEFALAGADVHDLKEKPAGGTVLIDWPIRNVNALKGFDTLALLAGDTHRTTIDRTLFAAGWRRHPAGMMTGHLPAWSDDRLPHTCFYQRAGSKRGSGPLSTTGHRADSAIARYALAAHYVRAGDHVLIDGADARDGMEILSALSRGSAFTSTADLPVDADSPLRLDSIADNSVDFIAAFAPPSESWQVALAEYARVLRLDGRLIVGWPVDATDDALPANWDELADFAGQFFLTEQRYGQYESTRELDAVELDAPASEWLILVASAEPVEGAAHRDDYTHPGFPTGDSAVPVLVDFAHAYDNPWLYRTMVQMGERLKDPVMLARLAEYVVQNARPDSADRGAALSVLGYRVLEKRMIESIPAILGLIEDYVAATQEGNRPPHVLRWRVSLAFLAGRLCELTGDRPQALIWYDAASGDEWSAFSPILATKTIGACFFAGRLCLGNGDTDAAKARFRRGVETGRQVAAADHGAHTGDPERPLPFYFQELAEVLDMTSQCANALFHMPLWGRDPGLYWQQVDVKRFGLASWALDLEQENDRLRRQLR